MKSSAVVTMLNTPESTVRKYAREYAEFLSPSAEATGGRHRDYTDHDVRVLKLIIEMKAAKSTQDTIDVTLNSLRDNGWERLPALDESALAIIPSPAALLEAQAERAVMQKEIDMLRERIDEMKATQADREDLIRKLAERETMLRLYRRRGLIDGDDDQ